MEPKDIIPEEEFNKSVKRAREQLKVVSELGQKLEILTEHVESRKRALDEEIEESLHEAVGHARDCLEKIRENVDPKLEKIVRLKLEEIDEKIERWKNEFRSIAQEELDSRSEAFAAKILSGLEGAVSERTATARDALRESLREEIGREIKSAAAEIGKKFAEESLRNRRRSQISLGLSVLAGLALGFWILSGR